MSPTVSAPNFQPAGEPLGSRCLGAFLFFLPAYGTVPRVVWSRPASVVGGCNGIS